MSMIDRILPSCGESTAQIANCLPDDSLGLIPEDTFALFIVTMQHITTDCNHKCDNAWSRDEQDCRTGIQAAFRCVREFCFGQSVAFFLSSTLSFVVELACGV